MPKAVCKTNNNRSCSWFGWRTKNKFSDDVTTERFCVSCGNKVTDKQFMKIIGKENL